MNLLWIFYWMSGGYNSVHANNREEALQKAKEMASQCTLFVDENSLHEGTYEELAKLDKEYSSLFN